MRVVLAIAAACGFLFSLSAVAQAPAPNSATLVSCAGLTGNGATLCQTLTTLNPAGGWAYGQHVNWLTGVTDRVAGSVPVSTSGHGALFTAAAAYAQGIYVLRPPRHAELGLANDQFIWMWNQSVANTSPTAATALPVGWSIVGTSASANAMWLAQSIANQGGLVVAAYSDAFDDVNCRPTYQAFLAKARTAKEVLDYQMTANLKRSLCSDDVAAGLGQTAVVRPNSAWATATTVGQYGPVVAAAGNGNANGATASDVFSAPVMTNGYVYFFAYNGPPVKHQGFAVGLYKAKGESNLSVAIERTQMGSVAVGVFAFDKSGQPIWLYGDGGLAASANWLSMPSEPASGATSYDDPKLYSYYVQPATSGQNYWDPNGDPAASVAVGSLAISANQFDNASLTGSASVTDSGVLAGPTGNITVDPGLTATVKNAALTWSPQGSTVLAQPAPAAAPSAGWWWVNATAAQWSAGGSFVPVGLFMDVQGSNVSAVIAGGIPVSNPAGSGSSVPPYRPSWVGFSGTITANNQQIVGNYYSCTVTGSSATCVPGTTATWTVAANGLTLSALINGQTVTFGRFRAAGGNPATQMVPIDLQLTGSTGTINTRASYISVGGGSLTPVLQDAGSSGLYIMATVFGPYVTITDTALPEHGFIDGTVYISKLAYAYVTYGGISTPQPIAIGAITKVTCSASKPNCPGKSGVPAGGLMGTMGVDQETSNIDSALAQMAAPFNTGYAYSFANKAMQIGLDAATRSRFIQITMPSQSAPDAPVPSFVRMSINTCLTFPGTSFASFCAPAGFDTGAPTSNIWAPTGRDLSLIGKPTVAGGKTYAIKTGQDVAFAMSGTSPATGQSVSLLSTTITAGTQGYINYLEIASQEEDAANRPEMNLGDNLLRSFDLLYDGVNGYVGVATPLPQ